MAQNHIETSHRAKIPSLKKELGIVPLIGGFFVLIFLRAKPISDTFQLIQFFVEFQYHCHLILQQKISLSLSVLSMVQTSHNSS
jgi:hypothetical protein